MPIWWRIGARAATSRWRRSSGRPICSACRLQQPLNERDVMEPSSAEAVTLADIQAAAIALTGQVIDSPCVRSRTLSKICGADIWLKLENQQYTGSFMERGALIRLLVLDE